MTMPARSARSRRRSSTCRPPRCNTPPGPACATPICAFRSRPTTCAKWCATSIPDASTSTRATPRSRRASPCTRSAATAAACNACAWRQPADRWCSPPTPRITTRTSRRAKSSPSSSMWRTRCAAMHGCRSWRLRPPHRAGARSARVAALSRAQQPDARHRPSARCGAARQLAQLPPLQADGR